MKWRNEDQFHLHWATLNFCALPENEPKGHLVGLTDVIFKRSRSHK